MNLAVYPLLQRPSCSLRGATFCPSQNRAEPLGRAWEGVGRGGCGVPLLPTLQCYIAPPNSGGCKVSPCVPGSCQMPPLSLSRVLCCFLYQENHSVPLCPSSSSFPQHLSYPSDSQFRNSFLQHISTPPVLCPGLLLLCGSQSPEPPFNSAKYVGSVCLFSSPLDCKLHEGWACLARKVHNRLCRKSNWNTLYMKSLSHVLVFLTQLCSTRAPSSWLPSSALC